MSIKDVAQNCKSYLRRLTKRPIVEPVLLVCIIVLVGVGSFLVGRLSIKEEMRPDVRICERDDSILLSEKTQAEVVAGDVGKEGAVVASKNGTKYHLPSCPGAKQISSANLITFSSIAAALAAGYAPASNCPGL